MYVCVASTNHIFCVHVLILNRHCQCMLPVTHTCRAFQNDIIKCAREMLAPHFYIPDKILQVRHAYDLRIATCILAYVLYF